MQCKVILFIILVIAVCSGRNCSTWHYLSEDGHCVCGSSLEDVVVCNDTLDVVGVLMGYCLTSDGDHSVVGHCIAKDIHREKLHSPLGNYYKVFPTLSEQDSNTCGFLNRHGRLCGQCKPNTYIHAYTYDMKCYPCSSEVWIDALKYIFIAYLPLTVFLIVVVIFHISVTSPAMNVPVLYCQALSIPIAVRFVWQFTLKYPPLRLLVQILGTLYGIWNLDFFRLIAPPICLRLDVMQMIALEFLVAAYPLLVLVCVYLLVTAHDRGCRLVVRLWRPFLWCSARIRQKWNVKYSIIDAFATFLLLSYIKFLNTSFDLLMYTKAYNEYGEYVGRYLFNNPTVEFMSHQHVPYAIIAVAVLVGLFVPLVLLLLYPMRWFQVFLNKCHLNSPGLRMFMECFQGYYRDRSDGGWECRYFAVVYPTARILFYPLYNIVLNQWSIFYVGWIILCIFFIGTTVLVQPYKSPYRMYNKLDIFMLSSLLLALLVLNQISSYISESDIIYIGFLCVCSLIPTLYFSTIISLSLKSLFCKLSRKRNNSLNDSVQPLHCSVETPMFGSVS